jgi:hypothetical protein
VGAVPTGGGSAGGAATTFEFHSKREIGLITQ